MLSLKDFAPQGESVASLSRQIAEGRLTHALLISGESGLGKWTLARTLAAALLCTGQEGDLLPCGKCKSCAEMAAGTHPDLIVLQKGEPLVPTDTKTVIPVSDVQEMIRRVSLRGFQGNRRVVLIRQAEDLNIPAQNKMLKTLEEPPEGVYFFLTCTQSDRLLPTIVSRCRPVKLHPWSEADLLRILEEKGVPKEKAAIAAREAEGSVGKAVSVSQDEQYWAFRGEVIQDILGCTKRSGIYQVSARWKDRKDDAENLFNVLSQVFSRMTRFALAVDQSPREDPDWPEVWARFARQAQTENLIRCSGAVNLARKRLQNNVQFQTVLEQLILSLMEASHQ